MATPAQWIAGSRPRTLPAAISPVLAGTAVASYFHLEVWWKAVLALGVALLLQVGVNFANDYSDGIRGTDTDRVGPMRLVGSGTASARAVKRAAFASLGLAALVGLVLAATTAWWLVAVGAVSILAAWFYTGGRRPYGYAGLGELMVFCFFGLVAVLGTTYVQVHANPTDWFRYVPVRGDSPWWWPAWGAAVGVGALACAILVANNLRDIPSDRLAGKRTLAVRLGEDRTRLLYVLLLGVAVLALFWVFAGTDVAALIGLVCLVPLARAAVTVLRGASGPGLVPVLQQTGAGELLYAAGMFIGLLIAR